MKKILLSLACLLFSQVNQAQFSESFEGSTSVPAGWSVISGGDPEETWAVEDYSNSYGFQAQNGNKTFSIYYSSTAHNDMLVTPQITVVAGVTDVLTFYGRSRNSNFPETISVKLSATNATSIASFSTPLINSVAPTTTNFSKYQVSLSSFVGQTIYIGFLSTTTDQFAFDIDNVTLGTTTSCKEPTSQLSFANVTTNSAVVVWGAVSPAPANGYDIYYSTSSVAPTSSTPATATVASNVSMLTVNQLTAGTRYYFYVRSKCSANSNSVWGNLGMIQTKFVDATVPYSYNFDNNVNVQSEGWVGNFVVTNQFPAFSQSPQNFCISDNLSTQTANSWLITRGISLTAGVTYTIKFYLRAFAQVSPSPQSVKLTVGDQQTIAAQTSQLWTTTTFANSAWEEQTIVYTPTTTGVKYFGINHFSPAQSVEVSLGFDTFSISSSLGIDEAKENSFKVFPNPVADIVNISSSLKIIEEVTIIDINGRIIKSEKGNFNTIQLSTSDLTSGVYFIKIKSEGTVTTEKIIKQ